MVPRNMFMVITSFELLFVYATSSATYFGLVRNFHKSTVLLVAQASKSSHLTRFSILLVQFEEMCVSLNSLAVITKQSIQAVTDTV